MRNEWQWRQQQFLVLYRVFLVRVIDLELLSSDGDTTRLVGQFISIFAGISFLLTAPILLIGGSHGADSAWTPEHFFIATTMLVAGGVSLLGWDSALPDRRDVLVLTPLPVRASTLFLAKIAALFAAPAIAMVAFNVFVGIGWPLLFASYGTGIVQSLRAWPAYWITVLGAGAFLFCTLLTLQGVAVNLLPRQLFLRLSAVFQAGILCGLVCVYILEPSLESTKALLAPGNQRVLAWLPTYWFLGLFQQLNGTMRPEFAWLAQRAWLALASSILGAATALLLSYYRMLPKIVEQAEIVPTVRGSLLPGGGLKTAITIFSLRTLLRSRQHRMILSFYLGIGLAIVVVYGRTSTRDTGHATAGLPVSSLLASVLMMILSVLALRVVAALPISLRANWIIQLTQSCPEWRYRRAARMAWLMLTVVPILLVVAGCFLSMYPWRPVMLHLSLLLVLGLLTVELCLSHFRKVPFACSYLPGKANLHFIFWAMLAALIGLLRKGLEFESEMLLQPWRFTFMVLGLVMITAGIGLLTETRSRRTDELVFDEEYSKAIVTLNLR